MKGRIWGESNGSVVFTVTHCLFKRVAHTLISPGIVGIEEWSSQEEVALDPPLSKEPFFRSKESG